MSEREYGFNKLAHAFYSLKSFGNIKRKLQIFDIRIFKYNIPLVEILGIIRIFAA